MSKLKNITKMDYPKQGLLGYYVRIQRDGTRYEKMFSVSSCGTMEAALAQAISYRNDVLEDWAAFCGGKDDVIQYQKTNTGYPGITLTRKDGSPVLCVNVHNKQGDPRPKNIYLPDKDSANFDKKFEEAFKKAKQMIDDNNRQRFGGRWYQYKSRKNLLKQ